MGDVGVRQMTVEDNGRWRFNVLNHIFGGWAEVMHISATVVDPQAGDGTPRDLSD